MKTIQLKTNIKCSACVSNATPFLNEAVGEGNWQVDISSPDKILSINAGNVADNEVIKAVEKAGYTARQLS